MKYNKPTMTIVEVEPEVMMNASLNTTDEKANPNYDILSNERHGSWGDLWND